MATTITCTDCTTQFDSNTGFLRPEGFLCGDCYRVRCEDPAYVAEMQRQLTGLLSTLTVASRTESDRRNPRKEPPLVPERAPDRLACESLVGLSIGDALGATLEGASFDKARLDDRLAPDGLLPWTDDTQMALGVVETLLAVGTVDQDRLARAFGRRFELWRGYGPGMHVVLPKLRDGADWRDLKDTVFRGGLFGNGAAMRVAPLGAYFYEAKVDTVVLEAERSAEVTHAHREALAGAVATAVAAWLATRSRGRAAPAASDLLSAARASLDSSLGVSRGLLAAQKLRGSVSLESAVNELGNGSNMSCPDTVPLALWIACHHLDDFSSAIRHACAAGGDTDTVAAIVGGFVAARVGLDGIPHEWLEAVETIPVQLD